MISAKRSQNKKNFILTIDNNNKRYPIRKLPEEFITWNLNQRISGLKKMLGQHHKSSPGLGGHLPVYITNNPETSLFTVSAATKGTGFVAKDEYLDYYINKFKTVYKQTDFKEKVSAKKTKEAIQQRISAILEFYENTNKIDLRCLSGLEIWPGRTSKNFMLDPRVSLHFLGMPSHDTPMKYYQWQINCIWEKIEPQDKRFEFGVVLRQLTMGNLNIVPGHIPTKQTPIRGNYPFGWTLWVIETINKGIQAIHS